MTKLKYTFTVSFLLATIFFTSFQNAQGEETVKLPPPKKPAVLTLVEAVMCEDLKDLESKGESIVFSVKLGHVICFTSFDPVPKKTDLVYEIELLRVHSSSTNDEPASKQ